MPQSIGNLHVLPKSQVMKQLCHNNYLDLTYPVSWNNIPLINYLREIHFLGSWGSLPQYESWNNFSSSWPIFEEIPLTNKSCRDFPNLDVTSLDQLSLVEIYRRDSFRLTEIRNVLSLCLMELLNILLLDMVKWCGLPLLNGVSGILHLIGLIKIIFSCSTEFSGVWSSDAIN